MESVVLIFDKKNNQINNQYMGRCIESGKLIVGCLLVQRAFNSATNNNNHNYYIFTNKSNIVNSYFNNQYIDETRLADISLDYSLAYKKLIAKSSLTPFNQVAQIKYHQESNKEVILIDPDTRTILIELKPTDEIPIELWDRTNTKAKELIKYALEYLNNAELLEENGWTLEDIELLNTLLNKDFDIKIHD